MNMTKCLCLIALVALTAGAFPYNVHAGKLTSLLRTSDAQDFVDITEALKANDPKPATTIPDYMRKSMPLEEGKVYVILTFSIEDGRSISIADYILSADGTDCECIGLTPQKLDFFDPRRFKITGPQEVKLLFSCPDTAENCDLQPSAGFPLAPVKNLVLIPKAPEPAPTAENPPEATETAQPAGEAAPAATETAQTAGTEAGAAPPAETPAETTAEAPAATAPAAPAPEAKTAAEPAAEPPAESAKPAPKPAPKPKQEEDSWF